MNLVVKVTPLHLVTGNCLESDTIFILAKVKIKYIKSSWFLFVCLLVILFYLEIKEGIKINELQILKQCYSICINAKITKNRDVSGGSQKSHRRIHNEVVLPVTHVDKAHPSNQEFPSK